MAMPLAARTFCISASTWPRPGRRHPSTKQCAKADARAGGAPAAPVRQRGTMSETDIHIAADDRPSPHPHASNMRRACPLVVGAVLIAIGGAGYYLWQRQE